MVAHSQFEAARQGRQILTMRIGNFNTGVSQSHLNGRNQTQVLGSLNRIIQVCVEDQRLDMMSMCEVGSHKQGFYSAGIFAGDLPVLDPRHGAQCSTTQNYITCWGFQADAAQLGFQELRLPQVFTLNAGTDPQLVVEVFSFKGQAKLVKGNLHIRTPTRSNVSLATRRRLVLQALQHIETIAAREQERYDDASQPIVCVLLGDTNLDAAGGNQAVQPLQPTNNRTWEHS
jgi:hypothetical protein